MNIDLYSVTADKKKMVKTKTAISSITGATCTEPCDVLRPQLILSGGASVNAINANYCFISTFGRYYFITDYTILSAERILITCEVDPLESWSSQILATNQLVTRSESIGKPTEIEDTLYPLKKNKEMFCIKFEGSQMNLDSATNSSYNFVLNVAGGAGQ